VNRYKRAPREKREGGVQATTLGTVADQGQVYFFFSKAAFGIWSAFLGLNGS